jgi:hypothetical protein
MEEEKSFFIEYFGDLPRLRIIDFLIDNLVYDYSLVEIARGAGVAYTTLIDIFPDLIKKEIVKETRQVGKSKMYRLNRENPAVEVMLAVDIKISELGIKKMLKIPA